MPSNNDGNDDNSSSNSRITTLDGSYGEGGGQILRNSASYAVLLGIDLRVQNIRAGRSKPGLRAQHVASVELPTRLVAGGDGSRLQGCFVGSTCLSYSPPTTTTTPTPKTTTASNHAYHDGQQELQERRITQDIGTAGSICLLLQSALPVALLATALPLHLTLHGGTNATMAPQYDYWYKVFLPTLQRQCGLRPDAVVARVVRRGYFPQGGGQVDVHIQRPLTTRQTLNPIQLTQRGDAVVSLLIRAYYTGNYYERGHAEEMVRMARQVLQQEQSSGLLWPKDDKKNVTIDIVVEKNAKGSSMGLLIVAETSTGCLLAGSALCDRRVDGVAAGTAAAKELIQAWMDGGCVDEWLSDQLILYMALAAGTSRVITGSLTLHCQTAIWVAQQLTQARFVVQRLDDDDNSDDDEKGANPSRSKRLRGGALRPPPQAEYGTHGRISGRHLIECKGIGLQGRAPSRDSS